METKLSFILNGKFFSKTDVKIPENQSTGTYFLDVIDKISMTGRLSAILFQDKVSYLFSADENILQSVFDSFGTYDEVLSFSGKPVFLHMHEKANNVGGEKYFESELLRVHPEMLEFLPINSEEKVKKYLEFVINVLNINYHPDDPFEDYCVDEKIIDSQGISIKIDIATTYFMDLLTNVCFAIADNKVYDWGFEVQQKNLFPIGVENQQETDEDELSDRDYARQELEKVFGKENSYSGSADWGGIPVWSVKGDSFTGVFIGIDDNDDVFLLERTSNEDEDGYSDIQINSCSADDLRTNLSGLIKEALTYQNSKSRLYRPSDELCSTFYNLLHSYIGLEAFYNGAADNFSGFEELFNKNYPFSEALEEIDIVSWCNRILLASEHNVDYFEKISFTDIDTITQSFQVFKDSLEKIYDINLGVMSEESNETYAKFSQLVFPQDKNYPFDSSFEDVVSDVNEWLNDEFFETLATGLSSSTSLNESKKPEKHFISTIKSRSGEKSIKLTKTQIEKVWDLEMENEDGQTLQEFLNDCYIDDVWEADDEKLVCDKIV